MGRTAGCRSYLTIRHGNLRVDHVFGGMSSVSPVLDSQPGFLGGNHDAHIQMSVAFNHTSVAAVAVLADLSAWIWNGDEGLPSEIPALRRPKHPPDTTWENDW